MFGCLAVAGVGLHHPLATGSLSHQAGVGVDIAVTPTHRTVPLGSLAAGRTRLRPVTAGPVVRELHPLQTVLHHEVAVVDVGPPVSPAHHVGLLVTVVLTVGQAGVVLAHLPVNLRNNNRNRPGRSSFLPHLVAGISTVNFPPLAIIFINLPVISADGNNVPGTVLGTGQRPKPQSLAQM